MKISASVLTAALYAVRQRSAEKSWPGSGAAIAALNAADHVRGIGRTATLTGPQAVALARALEHAGEHDCWKDLPSYVEDSGPDTVYAPRRRRRLYYRGEATVASAELWRQVAEELTPKQTEVVRKSQRFDLNRRGLPAEFFAITRRGRDKRGPIRSALNVLRSLKTLRLVRSWWPSDDPCDPRHYVLTEAGQRIAEVLSKRPADPTKDHQKNT